jgi:hypothetical protein
MQALLARFQVVFVGYPADDPLVQYLLEALNLRAGTRSRLFAFQGGQSNEARDLWEQRGVRAIPFDNSKSYDPLWDTLAAWAERARNVDGWYKRLLTAAAGGPANVEPHIRGQIAHILSTREGARRVSFADPPIPASWLLVMDSSLGTVNWDRSILVTKRVNASTLIRAWLSTSTSHPSPSITTNILPNGRKRSSEALLPLTV